MFCYAYHIVRIGLCLRSVPGVRVLVRAVDDWLLYRVGELASCLPMRRGGWCRLSVVPLSGYCFGGIFVYIGFPTNSYACSFCKLLVVVVCLLLFCIRVYFVGYVLRMLIEDCLSLCILCVLYVLLLRICLIDQHTPCHMCCILVCICHWDFCCHTTTLSIHTTVF